MNNLLDPIANAEVDINAPHWQESLAMDQNPLEEAGVRKPAEQVIQRVIELFLAANSKGRSQIRKLLADNENFTWAMVTPMSSDPEIVFRDSVLLVIMADTADTRDAISEIQNLVNSARASGINYRPIMRQLAKVAGTTDRYGFGSMRTVIKKQS